MIFVTTKQFFRTVLLDETSFHFIEPKLKLVNNFFERQRIINKFKNLRGENKGAAHPGAFIAVHFDLAHVAAKKTLAVSKFIAAE